MDSSVPCFPWQRVWVLLPEQLKGINPGNKPRELYGTCGCSWALSSARGRQGKVTGGVLWQFQLLEKKTLFLKTFCALALGDLGISPSATRDLSYVSQTLRERMWVWDGIEGENVDLGLYWGRERGFEVHTTVCRWRGLIPCSHSSAAPVWHNEASLGLIQSQKSFPLKKFPDFYNTCT